MNGELYVWYRLDISDSSEDSEVDSEVESTLNEIERCAQHLMQKLMITTGIQGRLLKRSDDGTHTWMEHYALFNPNASLIELSLEDLERYLGDLVNQIWPEHFPKRHMERFDLIGPSSI